MPKLIAVYSIYNEVHNIKNSLISIINHVDEVRIYDGAYNQYPGNTPGSNDGTLALLENLSRSCRKIRVITTDKFYPDQCAKRTRMLQELPGDSIGLIIDGDEFVANGMDFDLKEMDDADVGWVTLCSTLYEKPYKTPRLFRASIPGLHYAGRHYWVYDKYGKLVASHLHYSKQYKNKDVSLRIYNTRSISKEPLKKTFRHNRNVLESKFANEAAVYEKETTQDYIEHPNRSKGFKHQAHIIKWPKSPMYSLVIPISRPWAVDKWFNHFRHVEIPWKETEIYALVDNSDATMLSKVVKYLEKYFTSANGIRVYHTKKSPFPEFSRVKYRRDRIIDNWNIILPDLMGKIILGAEDDTLPDYDAYTKLLEAKLVTGATFIQGTIVGRWNSHIIPHWQISTKSGVISKIRSAVEGVDDLIPIQGGGWYCFVCDTEAFRRCDLMWTAKPPMGPDLWFTYNLHSKGLKCYGDWRINCVHFGHDFVLHPYGLPTTAAISYTLKGKIWRFEKRAIDPPVKGKPCGFDITGESRLNAEVTGTKEANTMGTPNVRALRTLATGSEVYPKGKEFLLDDPIKLKQWLNRGHVEMIVTTKPKAAPSARKRRLAALNVPEVVEVEKTEDVVIEQAYAPVPIMEDFESDVLSDFPVEEEIPDLFRDMESFEEKKEKPKWVRERNGLHRFAEWLVRKTGEGEWVATKDSDDAKDKKVFKSLVSAKAYIEKKNTG